MRRQRRAGHAQRLERLRSEHPLPEGGGLRLLRLALPRRGRLRLDLELALAQRCATGHILDSALAQRACEVCVGRGELLQRLQRLRVCQPLRLLKLDACEACEQLRVARLAEQLAGALDRRAIKSVSNGLQTRGSGVVTWQRGVVRSVDVSVARGV